MIAHVAALIAAALGVASCTSVLALDDYHSASDSLCKILERCYGAVGAGDCRAHIDVNLERSDDEITTGWLQSIATEGCFDNCTAAWSCLDIDPVCEPIGERCVVKDECCSFTTGAVDCVRNQCCRTDGQRCDSGADCCASTCTDHRCGGVVCRDPGAPCDIDEQCCSRSCRGRACTEGICRPDGFECTSADQCCSRSCGADGVCGSACNAEGASCETDAECCGGLVCYKIGAKRFCSPGECTPFEVDCFDHEDCCSKYCDPVHDVCGVACLSEGATCALPGECCTGACVDGVCAAGCSRAYCTSGDDCCSGACVAYTCAPECDPIKCGHDECAEGKPLRNDCMGLQKSQCVDEVCKIDSYCCCNAWDSFCVGLAQQACGLTCL